MREAVPFPKREAGLCFFIVQETCRFRRKWGRARRAYGGMDMKYRSEVRLRNDEACLLRSLEPSDAKEALAVCRKAAGETLNMMRYEDEWTMTVEQEAQFIERQLVSPKALMLGAFVDVRMAGTAIFQSVHPGDRARHRAGVGISILKAYWNQGVGTAMMRALIDAAKTTSLEQLELSVVSTNKSAIRLYTRCGFETYGRLPQMMKYRDGTYADENLMMLDLTKKTSP